MSQGASTEMATRLWAVALPQTSDRAAYRRRDRVGHRQPDAVAFASARTGANQQVAILARGEMQHTASAPEIYWWAMTGSNRRHPPCKGGHEKTAIYAEMLENSIKNGVFQFAIHAIGAISATIGGAQGNQQGIQPAKTDRALPRRRYLAWRGYDERSTLGSLGRRHVG
jgi:hypothetical protein